MKNYIIILLAAFSLLPSVYAQDTQKSGIPHIGDAAPSFTANTTKGVINFPGDFSGKWKILLSHPADFTPVCTSEILELSQMQDEFEKLDVKLLVISTESVEMHRDWIKSMESLRYKQRDTQKIRFPLIGDESRAVSKLYGMIPDDSYTTKNVRGVYVIDPKNKVRSVSFYPMSVGRNMDEIKRLVIAIQQTDKENIFTPANWNPGDDVLIPHQTAEAETGEVSDESSPGTYKLAWYMFFKKSD
ncbi:MAG TPA: peroxiredoxin [Bacteroidales bacterium]|nr:peroxiredoxin [Bacteroidales bacterium]HSA42110.1 peroxiredoxin [Bacteroidales bacterium]